MGEKKKRKEMKALNKNLFFIDAESDGLYGDFISVGIIVTDATCREIERFYYGIDLEHYSVKDEWTKEHVIPILGDYEKCDSQEELLRRVWNCWKKYKENAYAVGDVIFPVESRLFQKCVELDVLNNKLEGPFPLLDLCSMLRTKHIDPLIDRANLIEEKPNGEKHNALYDVEATIRIFRKYVLEVGNT